MNHQTSSFELLKQPSAWLPIAMSFTALALLIGYLIVADPNQPPAQDEGVVAHIFQILMGLQIPIGLFFTAKWLSKEPSKTLVVLMFQVLAWLAAFIPVYLLEH